MKTIWYYIKQAMIPAVYLIFMAMTAMGIAMISDANLVWLKAVLSVLNLGLYGFIVAATSYKDGQTALKVRIANDLERMQIIKTGEDRPLKLREEYKAWKGFMSGIVTCLPCLLLLIVHTILVFCVNPAYNGAGAAAGFLYMIFFIFVRLGVDIAAPSVYLYYFTLVSFAVIPLMTGIPYVLGARKIELQQQKIKEKQRQIYGDKA